MLEVNRSREDWEGSNLQRSKANARRSEGPRGQSLDGDFLGAPGGGAGSGLRWVRRPLWAELSGAPRTSPPLPGALPAASASGVLPTSRSVPKALAASAPSSEREDLESFRLGTPPIAPGEKSTHGSLARCSCRGSSNSGEGGGSENQNQVIGPQGRSELMQGQDAGTRAGVLRRQDLDSGLQLKGLGSRSFLAGVTDPLKL